MDIQKEFEKYQTCMLMVPSHEYHKNLIHVSKELSHNKICYVTLNKTYESLKELLNKTGIKTNNFVFIDGISRTFAGNKANTNDCFFVPSPGHLKELKEHIEKCLSKRYDILILDSLANTFQHVDKSEIEKFTKDIMEMAQKHSAKTILYTTPSISSRELFWEMCFMFPQIHIKKEDFKNNESMLIVDIMDLEGVCNQTAFPETAKKKGIIGKIKDKLK